MRPSLATSRRRFAAITASRRLSEDVCGELDVKSLQQASFPTSTSRRSTLAAIPSPGITCRDWASCDRRPLLFRKLHDRACQRMTRQRFGRGRRLQQLFGADFRSRDDGDNSRAAAGDGAGFVEHNRVDSTGDLQRRGILDQDSQLRSRPLPTMTAVGVANPNAHGQAVTRTATAQFSPIAGSLPINHQATNVIAASPRTAGTNQATTRSASRCTLCLWIPGALHQVR